MNMTTSDRAERCAIATELVSMKMLGADHKRIIRAQYLAISEIEYNNSTAYEASEYAIHKVAEEDVNA